MMTSTVALYYIFLILVTIAGLGCVTLLAAKIVDAIRKHNEKKDMEESFPEPYQDYYVDLSKVDLSKFGIVPEKEKIVIPRSRREYYVDLSKVEINK